jgi:hypothetical protein
LVVAVEEEECLMGWYCVVIVLVLEDEELIAFFSWRATFAR